MLLLTLVIGCICAIGRAQEFLLVGTVFSNINGLCPYEGINRSIDKPSLAVDMIIFPRYGVDTDWIGEHISTYLGNTTLTNYTSPNDGLVLWYTHISNKQACDISWIGGVDYVQVNGVDPNMERNAATPVLEQRAAALTTQKLPVSELRVMSQPTTVPDITKSENFVFEENPGQGTYLYMVDSGINESPADLVGRVDSNIIKTPDALDGRQDDTPDGHSTCCASKAGGRKFGVAKAATLIAVKSKLTYADTAVVFSLVKDDILRRGIQGKAVVSFSWGDPPERDGSVPGEWIRAASFMNSIMQDLDVPIVTCAGNFAKRSQQIDMYPMVYTRDTFPLIVVGSTNFDGVASGFSQNGPQLTVSSVGEDITCSSKTGVGSRRDSGTSFAAPQVAGLLAYFLGMDHVPFDTTHGQLALNALKYVRDTASWNRQSGIGQPRVAWNLIDDKQNPPKP